MANDVKQRIDLGLTNSDQGKAILDISTGKGARSGVTSSAYVAWKSNGCLVFEMCGDFSKQLRHVSGTATQKRIDTQHAEVFTVEVVALLVAEAKAFYAGKEGITEASQPLRGQ